MQAVSNISIRSQGAQAHSEPLHTRQEHPQVHIVLRTGLSGGSCDRPSSKGEEQVGGHRWFLFDGFSADGFHHRFSDPAYEGINIVVAGDVRRHGPQGATAAAVATVEVRKPLASGCSQARGGDDDGRALAEQLPHHCAGDGVRRGAGDHRNLSAECRSRGVHRITCQFLQLSGSTLGAMGEI